MPKDKFLATQELFNLHAPRFRQFFERKKDDLERDTFLALLSGKKILDAGCGSAHDAAYFIEKGFTAKGIDVSEELLFQAKRRHPEVPTKLMSLIKITFAKNTLDGVWCKEALQHLKRDQVDKALSSFYRILKPGGILFILTKRGEGEGNLPVEFNYALSLHYTFFRLDELRQKVTDVGFEVTDSYEVDNRKRYSQDQGWVVIFAKKPVE